jgi:pimeloyl-ACP methyl ester carboxylesterase
MAHVVFLHAFPLDSRMWSTQLGAFPASTSAPTLYPFGDSMEAWASRALETVGGEHLILVGCSMGGSCALEMARQAGHRVAALVLVGSKAGHRPEPEVRDHYVAVLREGGARRMWPGLAARFFGPTADPRVMESAEAIAMEQHPDDLVRAVQVFHSRPDADDVVMNWKKPLLVIGGDRDGVVSVEKSTALASSAPRGRLHVMQGCGHFANMERPAEFNAVVGDLIRLVEAAG